MAGGKKKVLCVDDEPHVLRALQWLLQKEFDIQTAATAAEGLRLVQAHDFDVVVSDQRMPGMTGVEFLREVRGLAPRAMRILLTGYSDLDAMVKSVNESEVFRFITKPWDIRTLPKLIAEAAEIARSEPVSAAPVPQEEGAGQASNVIPFSRTPGAGSRPAAAATPHEITTVAVHAAESILVIDDSPEVHEAVTQVVGNTLQVMHAFDLAEAARILNDRPVSVIVSEIRVGDVDATRLMRLMKQSNPETVSVVFSAQKDAEVMMSLINEGQVFRLIPKPFKPGFIRIVVESALKRHRSLLENPLLQRRFAVQETPQGTAEALIDDIGKIVGTAKAAKGNSQTARATPPSQPSPVGAKDSAVETAGARGAGTGAGSANAQRNGGMLSKLGSGLRNLFGT